MSIELQKIKSVSELKRGDVVRSPFGESYVVDGTFGDRATAVRTVDITNPMEWKKVVRVEGGWESEPVCPVCGTGQLKEDARVGGVTRCWKCQALIQAEVTTKYRVVQVPEPPAPERGAERPSDGFESPTLDKVQLFGGDGPSASERHRMSAANFDAVMERGARIQAGEEGLSLKERHRISKEVTEGLREGFKGGPSPLAEKAGIPLGRMTMMRGSTEPGVTTEAALKHSLLILKDAPTSSVLTGLAIEGEPETFVERATEIGKALGLNMELSPSGMAPRGSVAFNVSLAVKESDNG